jgi:hypothetical protein
MAQDAVNQVLIAFWPHDKFPHLLWGTITKFLGGYARVKEYGNSSFRPILVLDEESAAKLITELVSLKDERELEESTAISRYEEKLRNIIKCRGLSVGGGKVRTT